MPFLIVLSIGLRIDPCNIFSVVRSRSSWLKLVTLPTGNKLLAPNLEEWPPCRFHVGLLKKWMLLLVRKSDTVYDSRIAVGLRPF